MFDKGHKASVKFKKKKNADCYTKINKIFCTTP